jgi:Leucine-rich repeat (LRR) protein
VEALEVVFGDEKAKKMITEHAPLKVEASSSVVGHNGSHAGNFENLQEDNSQLRAENEKLNAEMDTHADHIGNLQEDNSQLRAENEKLNAEMDKLEAENKTMAQKRNAETDKLEAENKKMAQEIETLKKQIQEGSSSSTSAPADDQWHITLLKWIQSAGDFTDGSLAPNYCGNNKRFEPKFPKSKEDLLALTALRLNECNITGSIPAELGQLKNLIELSLYENNLTGEIPKELGQLASLTHLDLENNQLTGEIPKELGQLASLEELHLYGNQLTGTCFCFSLDLKVFRIVPVGWGDLCFD